MPPIRWFVIDTMARLTDFHREKKKFKRGCGYDLNIKNPRSFAEKIVWKKFYDRNPLLPIVADKYRVRAYLKDILGKELADQILVPLLYVTDKPENIPFSNLPAEYILKPNHASGRYIVVDSSRPGNPAEIIAECKQWLKEPYGLMLYEWAYQRIKRKIVIEKLLRDENGNFPVDYKFFVFNGKCHFIQVFYNNLAESKIASYLPDWTHLKIKGETPPADPEPKPNNLDWMIQLAEKLAVHLDSVRVDLLLWNGKVYFGEFTNYDSAGYFRWTPQSYDFELGSKWKITPQYWKKDKEIPALSRRYSHQKGDFKITVDV